MLWKEGFRTDSTDSISSSRMSWEYLLLPGHMRAFSVWLVSLAFSSAEDVENAWQVSESHSNFRSFGRKERHTW